MRLRDVRAGKPKGHSQYGDEHVLRAIFDAIGTTTRAACEFGAYDGIDCSNTAWCRAEGWNVTLIEADPDRFAMLRATMEAASPLTMIPIEEGVRDFVWQKDGGLLQTVRCVPAAVTPDNIGELVPAGLDLLSIDVDGDDIFLLEALREDQVPRVLVIEVNQSVPWWLSVRPAALGGRFGSSARAILDVAGEMGYLLVEACGCNLILVHTDAAPNPVLHGVRGNRLEHEILIDWQAEEPSLTWHVSDYDGRPYLMGANPPWGSMFPTPAWLAESPDVALWTEPR